MHQLEELFEQTPDTLGGVPVGSATSALGAILLSVAYASSAPIHRRMFLDFNVTQSEDTLGRFLAEEPAIILLNLLRSVHNQIMAESIDLPPEDARVLYENLWDLYED